MVDQKIVSLLVVVAVVVIVAVIGLLMGTNGITGAAVAQYACYDDADCNDGITATQDTCKNPGTIGSLCITKPA